MIWQWIVDGIARLLVQLKLAAAGIAGRILSTFGLTIVTFEAVLPQLKAFILQHVAACLRRLNRPSAISASAWSSA
jgi:hypothetical protein